MPWIKLHEALTRGEKREIPRATRFLFLELALYARPSSGSIRLARVGSVADAVHDLIGGSKRELKAGLEELSQAGMVRVDEGSDGRMLVIPSWSKWNEPPGASTERVRRHRERQGQRRDEGENANPAPETRSTSDTERAETNIEERRGEERKGGETSAGPVSVSPANEAFAATEVFAEAVRVATGTPYAVPAFGQRDLAAVLAHHAPKAPWQQRRGWLIEQAKAFVAATRGDPMTHQGFKPGRFLAWLNAGAPAEFGRSPRPAVVAAPAPYHAQWSPPKVDDRSAANLQPQEGNEPWLGATTQGGRS